MFFSKLPKRLPLLLYTLTMAGSSLISPVLVSGFAAPVSTTLRRSIINPSSQKAFLPSRVCANDASALGAVAAPPLSPFSCDPVRHKTSAILLSINDIGDLDAGKILVGGTIILAISAFVYANIVYTPEIIQNARLMEKEDDMRTVLSLVSEYQTKGSSIEELREPLEKVLGMTIEEYVSKVDTTDVESVAAADKQLANTLRPICVVNK